MKFLPYLAFVLTTALYAADHPLLKDPTVFQRQELNETTGKTIHGGKLWIIEADGSHLRQITFGHTYDEHASMYADQQHALYSESPGAGVHVGPGARLVKLNIYTGAREVIAEEPSCALHHASLSPVDDLIAYHRDCGNRQAQWQNLGADAFELPMRATNGVRTSTGIIAMHEKNLTQVPREVSLVLYEGKGNDTTAKVLVDDKVLHRRAAISPDEKLMAWQTNVAPNGDEIYIANIDGSKPRNLTNAGGNDGHPWFSRSGEKIVFESDRTGNWEIWILDLKSGKQAQLTESQGRYVSTRARM